MNVTTRPLTADELVQLVSKSPSPWKEIFFLGTFTGLRICDLLQLPWVETPPSEPIREKKTGKLKTIIWTDLSVSYWTQLFFYGKPRDYLFPFRDPSTYRKSLVRACNTLKINAYRIAFHSLRKSHAVIAYRSGGIVAARSAMNHSSIDTTQRYIEEALMFETSTAYDSIFLPRI